MDQMQPGSFYGDSIAMLPQYGFGSLVTEPQTMCSGFRAAGLCRLADHLASVKHEGCICASLAFMGAEDSILPMPRHADAKKQQRVEITPEMMKAGKRAFLRWKESDDWYSVAVREIYTAMSLAVHDGRSQDDDQEPAKAE